MASRTGNVFRLEAAEGIRTYPTHAFRVSDTVIISVIGSMGEATNPTLLIELAGPLRNRGHQNRADAGDIRIDESVGE